MSLYVVLGAGPVGRAVTVALRQAGADVRVVSRSGRPVAGADAVAVDVVGDSDGLRRAVRGATTVYQALNPAYTRWAQDFPPLQRAALDAARDAAARFVAIDNLYAWGRSGGLALTESTVQVPVARKGRVRAAMAAELWRAHAAGDVDITVGHASDYFGGDAGDGTALGDAPFAAVLAGRAAWLSGDPDRRHSYSYLPDIGRGLATLGTDRRASGQRWFLPVADDAWTTRAMLDRAAGMDGRPARVRAVPAWAVRVAGVAIPLARELGEMAYEFEEDYLVDSSKIRDLGVTATPVEDAVVATAEAARARSRAA